MIIRQRQTFADPFLLKVVYPYVQPKDHRTLARVSKYWYEEVAELGHKDADVSAQWLADAAAGDESWWQRIADTVTRWLEPDALEPVPVAVRSDEHSRRGVRRKK